MLEDGIRHLLSLYMNFKSGKITIQGQKWEFDDFVQYISEFTQQKLQPSDKEVTIHLCSQRALKHTELIDEFCNNLVQYLNENYLRNIVSYQLISVSGVMKVELTVRYRRFGKVRRILRKYTRFALDPFTRMTFNRQQYNLDEYTRVIVDFSRNKTPRETAHETESVAFFNEDHCMNRYEMTNFGVSLINELTENNNQNVFDYHIKRNAAGKQELVIIRYDRRWMSRNGPRASPEHFSDDDTITERSSRLHADLRSIVKSLRTRLTLLESSTLTLCELS